jgi:hypothetical protein
MTELLGSPALNQTRFEPRKRHESSSASLGICVSGRQFATSGHSETGLPSRAIHQTKDAYHDSPRNQATRSHDSGSTVPDRILVRHG